jgi:hypothetical protein
VAAVLFGTNTRMLAKCHDIPRTIPHVGQRLDAKSHYLLLLSTLHVISDPAECRQKIRIQYAERSAFACTRSSISTCTNA